MLNAETPAATAGEVQAVEPGDEAAPMEVGAAEQHVAEAAEDESSEDEGEAGEENEAEAGEENEALAAELEARCQAPCMHACTMHVYEC